MTIDIIQIVLAAFLILAILLQNRGAGLGSAFGGADNVYHARRSLEKWLFYFTIISAILLLAVAIVNIIF